MRHFFILFINIITIRGQRSYTSSCTDKMKLRGTRNLAVGSTTCLRQSSSQATVTSPAASVESHSGVMGGCALDLKDSPHSGATSWPVDSKLAHDGEKMGHLWHDMTYSATLKDRQSEGRHFTPAI